MAYVQVQTVGVYNVELKRPDQEDSSDSWVLIYVEWQVSSSLAFLTSKVGS